MDNIMEYKGYVGSVEFSEQGKIFFGKVEGIHSLISYEGTTVDELTKDFQDAIESYFSLCESEGIEPELPTLQV